jgi:protein gp37
MAQKTGIEWCDHTFNSWWGCQKWSPGCASCYALTLSKRFGHKNIWGPPKTTRRRGMSDKYWQEPHKWNTAAANMGRRARVFCSSMADVFEDHPDVTEWRARLWELISGTDWLDWLLLTKRPENMRAMLPAAWLEQPRANVWLGASAENQEYFDKRIDVLLSTPAAVHFLSCEPLIGPIDMRGYRPSWVIVGGESGAGARAMETDWARSLVYQCQAKGVPVFMKQMGSAWARDQHYAGKSVAQHGDTKGHDIQYWPSDLRVREFPR